MTRKLLPPGPLHRASLPQSYRDLPERMLDLLDSDILEIVTRYGGRAPASGVRASLCRQKSAPVKSPSQRVWGIRSTAEMIDVAIGLGFGVEIRTLRNGRHVHIRHGYGRGF